MNTANKCFSSYRVGSVNFSQRKIGHAHNNSVHSENANRIRMCTWISFSFRIGQGNESFFFIHDQNTAETSQPQAQTSDDWRAIDRACPRGLQRPLEKFDSARLSRKKANFANRRKLLWRGNTFKETKHDRFGKRRAATRAEKIEDQSTEADVNAFRRSIGLLFFFLFSMIV